MSLGYSSWGKYGGLQKKSHLCDYLRIKTKTAAMTRITGTVLPEWLCWNQKLAQSKTLLVVPTYFSGNYTFLEHTEGFFTRTVTNLNFCALIYDSLSLIFYYHDPCPPQSSQNWRNFNRTPTPCPILNSLRIFKLFLLAQLNLNNFFKLFEEYDSNKISMSRS